MRRVVMMLLVLGLIALAPASAASAVQTSSISLAAGFEPSPNKLREYMLNVTSSLLKSASGGRLDVTGKWRSEMIANEFRYNHGIDQLHQATGIPQWIRDANGKLVPFGGGQDSYDAVQVRNLEEQYKKKPLRVQATKPKQFMKNVGGTLMGLTFYPLGAQIGAGISDLTGAWLGYDPQGSVCSWTADKGLAGTAVEMLSGRDCSMWGMPESYVPNGDAGVTWTAATWNGGSAHYLGGYVGGQAGEGKNTYCYAYTPPASWTEDGKQVALGIRTAHPTYQGGTYNGFMWGVGPFAISGSSSPGSPKGSCPSGSTHYIMEINHSTLALQYWNPPLYVFIKEPGSAKSTTVGQQPADGPNDPERVLECVITMTDGTQVRSTGGTYRESDGQIAPPSCPNVPPGKTPKEISVGEVGKTDPLYKEPVTEEYANWWESYPECREGGCKLDLVKKTTGSPSASCFDLEQTCADWWTDPSKADNYQCKYGVRDVSIDECAVYSGLFKPGRTEVGSPYSDPMTGEWSGGSSAPGLDKQAMTQNVQDPGKARSCNGMALKGFDPIGFVMRPVQCAMEWSFVPRPTVLLLTQKQIELAAKESKPGLLMSGLEAWGGIIPSSGGCMGPEVRIDFLEFHWSGYPLQACTGPLVQAATVTRLVLTISFIILGVVAITRYLGRVFGFGGIGESGGKP